MTPKAAFHEMLDTIERIVVDGTDDEAVTSLLATATAIISIALLRLSPPEREAILCGLEAGVRNHFEQVLACRSVTPRASNGHAA
jgi:hypothetical protein